MMQIETQRKISPVLSYETISPNNGSRRPSIIKPVKEEILYSTKSLQLSEYTFEDEHGKAKSAEVIRKRYLIDVKDSNDDSKEDTILSVAILKRHILCDCLVLVRQYRPTLKSYVLEFPARIVEQRYSDKSGDLAVEVLKDNTGYGSTVVAFISPETATDPELCDSKVKLVSMIIDGDDPIKNNLFRSMKKRNENGNNQDETNQNENVNQEEDENEIEIISLPINGLLDRLNEYYNHGTIVDSRVYAFAIGLKKGEKLSQSTVKPENIEIAI